MRYFAALLITVVCVSGAEASLLLNGDAETGDMSGWSVDLSGASSGNTGIIAAVQSLSQSTGTVTPYEGRYFFSFATQATGSTPNAGDTIWMYQTGTAGLDQYALRLTGMYQTETYLGLSDVAEVVLSIYDPSNSLLDSVTSGSLISPNLTWQSFELSLLIPVNAASWKVELQGTDDSTTFTNVFYDDLELAAIVPEPTTLIIWSIFGILALATRRPR